MKSALSGTNCIVHVDFSENYACKLAEEVQGMHFGASRHQVSLHTGMIYTQQEAKPFSTLSSSTRHDAAAI